MSSTEQIIRAKMANIFWSACAVRIIRKGYAEFMETIFNEIEERVRQFPNEDAIGTENDILQMMALKGDEITREVLSEMTFAEEGVYEGSNRVH